MVVRTILRTSQVQRLVRAEVGRIESVSDVHLGGSEEESVYR